MVVNGEELLKLMPVQPMLIDKFTKHGVSHGLSEAGYDIRIKQNIVFNPLQNGIRFNLASSIEEFNMPKGLVGIVHDKSTWARKGLSVFNTVIEPGWRGFLTLELVYHGEEELIIKEGSGIAQVLFHKVAVPALYKGKYQDQEDMPILPKESK